MQIPFFVAQENDFFVVFKPPNVLSHPTRPDGRPTLLGWVQEKFPGEFIALANRLDRETSGLILVARSVEAASRFGAMMMQRMIEKDYLALVSGEVKEDHGMMEAPMGRLGLSETNPIWLRQGIKPDGATARTEYWCLARSPELSLLRLRAHTGRLHQLRVHLAYLGHPVMGDKLYGPDPLLYLKFISEGWTDEHAQKLMFPRHALHAYRLRFFWNGLAREFTSCMPEDMQSLAGKHFPVKEALLKT